MSYWSRIANVFRLNRVDREIDEELASHIQEAIEQGRDPEEARRAFGSMLRRREDSRDVRIAAWLDSLRADVVFGWRQLRKNKAVSSAAVLSLALAMGACMSAFRLIDALLLRPMPVADSARLFFLTYSYNDATAKTDTGDSFDYPQFRTLRAAAKDDAELIAIGPPNRNALTFGSDEEMEKFWRQPVSGWMFRSFGLKPALGRLLADSDDVTPGAHPVAVLSYDYWRRRFGGDRNVIGRKFRMGTDLYEIVGVCQEGFTGTEPGTLTDIFVPTMMNSKAINNADWKWFRIWVRLKPGRATEPVREKLRAAVSAYRHERVKTWPATMRRWIPEYVEPVVFLEPAAAGVSTLQKQYRVSLAALGAVVAMVLFIACANVANLMMAQAAARAREMALRVSIGAGRWRLVQLVMVESVIVAVLAAVLGGLFAWWSAPFVVSRINPADNPARLMLPADWRVLGFAVVLALAVTLLFGLIPALRASVVKPMSALRGGEEPHSRRRLMNGLIAAQVAFCFLVHFVTGLFVATFDRISHQPVGFVADRLLTLETVTKENKPSTHWDQVREQLQGVHGVESVANCGWALLSGIGWTGQISVNGKSPDNDEAYFLTVSPGWLSTMRIPLIDGRDFRPQDVHPGGAIVNEVFARHYFDGQNPVGRTFETAVSNKLSRIQIVGYVRDARYRDMREPLRPIAYVPFDDKKKGADWATFVVRTTTSNPLDLALVLRHGVSRARPEFRVVNIHTQTDLIEQHTVRERLLAMLSLFFAVVALVLAGVGLYGVLNYTVLQRRREIGIRMALGSSAAGVARRITSEVFSMLLLGAAAGLVAGMASQRYLENLLYQVKPNDLAMLAFPALTIFSAALLAELPPVIRAVHIDPAVILRAE